MSVLCGSINARKVESISHHTMVEHPRLSIIASKAVNHLLCPFPLSLSIQSHRNDRKWSQQIQCLRGENRQFTGRKGTCAHKDGQEYSQRLSVDIPFLCLVVPETIWESEEVTAVHCIQKTRGQTSWQMNAHAPPNFQTGAHTILELLSLQTSTYTLQIFLNKQRSVYTPPSSLNSQTSAHVPPSFLDLHTSVHKSPSFLNSQPNFHMRPSCVILWKSADAQQRNVILQSSAQIYKTFCTCRRVLIRHQALCTGNQSHRKAFLTIRQALTHHQCSISCQQAPLHYKAICAGRQVLRHNRAFCTGIQPPIHHQVFLSQHGADASWSLQHLRTITCTAPSFRSSQTRACTLQSFLNWQIITQKSQSVYTSQSILSLQTGAHSLQNSWSACR